MCLDRGRDVQSPVVADARDRPVGARPAVRAFGGLPGGSFGRHGRETTAKDDVHHLLLGGIAVFERDLLGQDVEAQDRLGGEIADFVDAGDAAPVHEDDRAVAVARLTAGRLQRELVEQLGHRADAVGADVARREAVFRGDVADHRAGQRVADDVDLFHLVGRDLGLGARAAGFDQRGEADEQGGEGVLGHVTSHRDPRAVPWQGAVIFTMP